MSFEAKQIRRLRARLNPKHIRTREADGTLLNYLEGWFVVSEANRIFGFDGWDRETVASQCVWTKQLGGAFRSSLCCSCKDYGTSWRQIGLCVRDRDRANPLLHRLAKLMKWR